MKKIFIISFLFVLSFRITAQWSTTGALNPSNVTTGGRVGVGITPVTSLDVNAPSVVSNNSEGAERLAYFTVNDNSRTTDFFQITNATSADNTFTPVLWGYHSSNNGYALRMIGSILPGNDNGTTALVNFDARRVESPNLFSNTWGTPSAVTSRPLFEFSHLNNPLVRIYPNGSTDALFGIGTGTVAPTAQFHTTGTVRFAGLGSTTTGSNVIVSDANGNLFTRNISSFLTNTCNTINSIPRVTATNTLGCSQIYDNGTNVLIGTTTPSAANWKLEVNGDARFHGIIQTSDRRYKKNINSINGALQLVLALHGKSYSFKRDEFPSKNFNNKLHYGFIAQEVEEVLPDVVYTNEDGFKSMDYVALIPILVEALKEQNEKIEALESQISGSLTSRVENADVQKFTGSLLYQNNPNPYSGTTEINYFISEDFNNASILVFDLQGNLLLNKGITSKGEGKVFIERNELQSGSFIYSLFVDGIEVQNKKMIKLN